MNPFLNADQRLQKRFESRLKRLKKLESAIRRIGDGDQREKSVAEYNRLMKMATDVSQRLEQLLATGKTFEWLRKDAVSLLGKFEDSLEALRAEIGEMELGESEYVVEVFDPAEQPPVAVQTPTEKVSKITGVVAEPAPREIPSEDQPARQIPQPQPSPVRKKARVGDDPKAGMRRLSCWRTEVSTWIGDLSRMAGKIASLESKVPDSIQPLDWRRSLESVRIQHRRAMEKVGQCKRWIQRGQPLMAAREADWQACFSRALAELGILEEKLAEVSIVPDRVRKLEAAKAGQSTTRRPITQRITRTGRQKPSMVGIPLFKTPSSSE